MQLEKSGHGPKKNLLVLNVVSATMWPFMKHLNVSLITPEQWGLIKIFFLLDIILQHIFQLYDV